MFDLQEIINQRIRKLRRGLAPDGYRPEPGEEAEFLTRQDVVDALRQAGLVDKRGKFIKLVKE